VRFRQQVRPGSLQEVREYVSRWGFRLPAPSIGRPSNLFYRIARNAGVQVIRSGGVVRGFTNWGPFRLPKVTTKHQARYSEGHHFIMRFDASGPVQTSIRRTLGLDPRMINFSVVKLGDKLEEIKDIEGKVQWNKSRSITDTIQASRS
jgi:small subunit ribosomal protein S6